MSAASVHAPDARPTRARARARALPAWWPLAALTILAAALRFSTLDLQSFWYDEAFTVVHVLHPSLWATLRGVAHSENTPPLWYVLAWADARVFGTGEVALRWPSALAGVATVPVAWAIGRELTGRRATAIATAALVAVNPLLVWYSQEARAYGLFVLCAALAMLCFLRALRAPTAANMAAFALTGSLALLSHYFAVFLLVPMALWLLWDRSSRRRALPAIAVLALVGLALLPLISAQGGHGTQWIGEWALSSRIQAIPQYYLTGYSGAPLGHGVELLIALPILAGLGYGLWSVLDPAEERGALIALAIAAGGILLPLALAVLGADYLAPRNLVAAMVPVTALIALITVCRRAGAVGVALVTLTALAFLAITIDVDLSPRLQRGDWRGLAKVLALPLPRARRGARPAWAAVRSPRCSWAPRRCSTTCRRSSRSRMDARSRSARSTRPATRRCAPAPPPRPRRAFAWPPSADVNGLIAYRFISPVPRTVSVAALRAHVITLAHPYVFVAYDLRR